MQHVSNNFDILKVNGSTHIHMLTIEKMWKKSLIHSNINMRSEVVTCVLINHDKCKMQPMNNGFNMLQMNGQLMYHVDS